MLDKQTVVILEDRGWKHTETGGGCTAYEIKLEDAELMMTVHNDASVPKSLDDRVVISVYDHTGLHLCEFHCILNDYIEGEFEIHK